MTDSGSEFPDMWLLGRYLLLAILTMPADQVQAEFEDGIAVFPIGVRARVARMRQRGVAEEIVISVIRASMAQDILLKYPLSIDDFDDMLIAASLGYEVDVLSRVRVTDCRVTQWTVDTWVSNNWGYAPCLN